MALCLYHPEHGYYMQDRERTGAGGDYFTSPELHPIFARLLARQAAEIWERLEQPSPFTWVEMGAGRGWFARDFMLWVREARADFWAALEYVVVEPAAGARARVLNRLKKEGLDARVRALANLEKLEPVTGCFFSNELVDAFPVSVVTRAQGRLREIYVVSESDTLREKLGPLSDSATAAAVARYAPALEEGQRVEMNLSAVQWIRSLAARLVRGFVITIDYGDLAAQLYTAERPRGTLLAYHHHRASEGFFHAPGEQDLTAHVNFSILMDVGREEGFEVTGLTTQERFLMALGHANQFGDLYDPGQTEGLRLNARLKLKRLIHPEGMGQVFKVLILHRGLSAPQLTGLEFGGWPGKS
jgi:SAM-dependent MidA family methyltransferase